MKDRVRISLTLRPEIVNLLDNKIDGTKIRNRSHAVEHYLKKALVTGVGQAIVLIEDQDKALTDICGVTLIERMIDRMHRASIHKVIVCCSSQYSEIKRILSQKKYTKLDISYVNNERKGTAAALLACKNQLEPGNFLFIYGDVLAEIDFYDLRDFHVSQNAIGTLTVTSIADPKPWGVVRVKRNLITDFIEKPTTADVEELRLTNMINGGIYAFHPQIFAYINEKSTSLEKDIFPRLIKDKQLYSYLLDGVWVNVSRKDLLVHAQKYCTPKN